jgi:A/G-specific adenine glycosylase
LVELGDSVHIRPSNLNQALMELGATVCIPRNPRCLICPLMEICRAYQSKEQDSYPPKKKPKQWVAVKEHLHCAVNETGEVLLRRRSEGEWRAGLWDLLDQKPQSLKSKPLLLGKIESRHIVTRHKIQRSTEVWRVKKSAASDELRWVPLENPNVPMGSALKKTLQKIVADFPGLLSK